MIWRVAWNRSDRQCRSHVGAGLARDGVRSASLSVAGPPLSQASQLPHRPSSVLERERQLEGDLLTLYQPMLELRRVMDQHILPGK